MKWARGTESKTGKQRHRDGGVIHGVQRFYTSVSSNFFLQDELSFRPEQSTVEGKMLECKT